MRYTLSMEKRQELTDLNQQLCFPLYVASNKMKRRYNDFLNYLELTYTQYIVIAALWKKDDVSQKELGTYLGLKSNTLTPLLRKLELKGLVDIVKNKSDFRSIKIRLTEKGKALKEKAVSVPRDIIKPFSLSSSEMENLLAILDKFIEESDD